MSSLPPVIRELPGVQARAIGQASNASATNEAGAVSSSPQAMVYEGSGANRQSDARQDVRRQQFEADLANNIALASQLTQAGAPPDARGLATVAGMAMRHSPTFAATIAAAENVAVSMNKNPSAQTQYQNAASAFASQANLTPNYAGDVSYLVSRIVMDAMTQATGTVRDAVKSQVQNNLKLIEQLQSYEQQLTDKLNSLEGSQTKEVTVVEMDFQLGADGDVEAVADAEPSGKMDAKATVSFRDQVTAAQNDPERQIKVDEGDGTKMVMEAGSINSQDPPKVVRMNAEQLLNEIHETRDQITALQRANKSMQSQPSTSPTTTNPNWFLPNSLVQQQGQSPQA